jgi:hypothetical protein
MIPHPAAGFKRYGPSLSRPFGSGCFDETVVSTPSNDFQSPPYVIVLKKHVKVDNTDLWMKFRAKRLASCIGASCGCSGLPTKTLDSKTIAVP